MTFWDDLLTELTDVVLPSYGMGRTLPDDGYHRLVRYAEYDYPDQNGVDNTDLRRAFVEGGVIGYEAVLVFGPPSGLDRLQADAYMAGVVMGERLWRDDQPITCGECNQSDDNCVCTWDELDDDLDEEDADADVRA